MSRAILALAAALAQASARGAVVVVITHRTSVPGVANKMLVLRDGQQQAFGARDEVLAALNQAARQAAARAAPAQAPMALGQAVA